VGQCGVTSIVIVEDEQRIRALMTSVLADRGYDVAASATALDGLRTIVDRSPDLVILDLGLPDLDGMELLKMIRAVTNVPVIVASARGEDRDIIGTLNLGADDHLVKPFSIEQLEARVRAVLRRASAMPEDERVVVGALVVDPAAREATLDGEVLQLSPKEFDLLAYLATRAGDVVSKRELIAEVWRQPWGGSEKTVDVHLSWLRRKLGESAADSRYIHTVHGVGVKLVAPS